MTRCADTRCLAFLGDVMLGRGVSRSLHRHGPEWLWGDALPVLHAADAVFANLESPITASRRRWNDGWKMFHFRADPTAIRVLECGRVRFVCLANNHILDFAEQGLSDTLEALDAAGIRYAGAGRDATAAAAPAMLELPGLVVGLIAATDNMREFAAGPNRAGVNFAAFTPDTAGLNWIRQAVIELRRAGAALVVLSLHWGPNMRRSPSRRFRAFAHAVIDFGVDVVHGHSAHVVQAIERHGNGVILYDTGNFIDDYWKFPLRRTIWSFIFLLHVSAGRLVKLQLVPVLLHASPLGLAKGTTSQAIKEHMMSLCTEFDTPAVDTPAGLEIPLT
ncbi:CapA family protein [Reyranella sp. CPCC 100927]|uniref:CapA family protein n=1 Tax=Reyranella sp. CPCC 100927 TaxID=2599616 RepID=UPI0011B78974|nr:CapA family protein [Reyranella sp. CPCC 100927]TWT13717.1 CapA family protein [Reyranella sp. CPCC 100927]